MFSLKQISLPAFLLLIAAFYCSCDKEDKIKGPCSLSNIEIKDKSTLEFEFDDKKRVSKINWLDENEQLVKYRRVSYAANDKISTLVDLSADEDTMLKVTFSDANQQIYIDMVSQITSREPIHEPTWVDYNTNDSGITLLEVVNYTIEDLKHSQIIRLDCLVSTTSYTKYFSRNSPEGVVEQVAKYEFDDNENPYYNSYFLYPEMRELIFFKKNVKNATYTTANGVTLSKSFSTEIKRVNNSLPTSIEKKYYDGREEIQELKYQCYE